MLTFTVTWHPSFVCRKLFKFPFSPLKLFGKLKTNFPGMMVRMASTKIPVCFDRMKTKKHDRNRHYCFWLVNIQKISSLKLWCQSELNLTPMMFGKSSTKSPHFILIGQETHTKKNHFGKSLLSRFCVNRLEIRFKIYSLIEFNKKKNTFVLKWFQIAVITLKLFIR